MATLLSRSPRRLPRFLKPQTLLSPTLTSPSPPHDLPARIPPLGFRESGWSAPPQWQWHRTLCTYSDPRSSGTCDAGLAAATGASSLPLRMRRGHAASPDVAQVSADKGVDAKKGGRKAATRKVKAEYLSTGDSTTTLCSEAIKIMTYNVCHREDLELRSRMLALGDIIQHHSPDLICLQEVTPDIYLLLEKFDWWPEYKCSCGMKGSEYMPHISMMHMRRPYYCMQMSKLPVDYFEYLPLFESKTGRDMCMANFNIGGVTLVLVTSHLQSNERVAQAKGCLLFSGGLQSRRNVIFCGDMNWDDQIDGSLPLPDGWVDAWAELRPGEDGWTYDTEANAMLSAAYRKLQVRPDQFVCKLPDFKLQGIEMVGKEPIPGVSHVKVKKVRGVARELTLPVLPSDHFGLILTITPRAGSSASSE